MNKSKLKEIAAILAKEHAKPLLKSGFIPAGLHPYYDENGELIYFKIRLKHPNGKKWIRPFHFNSKENKYVMREPELKNKKPLYNLLELLKRPDEPVLIHEGELCCEKTSKLGILSVTSGGATSAKKTDWSQLAGRNVYIWPDNDLEGFGFVEEVRHILTEIKCKIRVIDVKKLGIVEKGDVVDWLKANPNTTQKNILSLPTIEELSNDNVNDYEKIINELAKLSVIDYQHQRKDSAKCLKISVTVLDDLVKQSRSISNTNASDILTNVEPWHEPVDGKCLLDELEKILNRFLVFSSSHESKAIALWILFSYCIDAADVAPILLVNSPEKRCGKSTLLSAVQRLVNCPLMASNITPAAMFRSIEKWRPTLMIDEADSFLPRNEELRGVINSGHTRDSAFVIRCVGDNNEPVKFNTWCAKVIAGIGQFAETIQDRAIIIQLRRKLASEKREKLHGNVHTLLFDELIKKCLRFANDNIPKLTALKPQAPEELNDRAADNWQALFAIAQLAGNDWFQHAKNAALYLSGRTQDSISLSTELLLDIKKIFASKKIDKISTEDLIAALCSNSERPWATLCKDKPINPHKLSKMLNKYGVSSGTIRLSNDVTKKGYYLNSFSDAFSRYVHASQNDTTSQTLNCETSEAFEIRHKNEMCRTERTQNSISRGVCDIVTDKNADLENGSKEIVRVVI